MTDYLTLEDALVIVAEAGFVVRDVGLLEAAIARPRTTVFGEDAYPDVDAKAAPLCESINRSHPLLDGNKRLSWIATKVFYRLNGYRLVASDVDDAERMILRVAAGDAEFTELAGWLREHRTKTAG